MYDCTYDQTTNSKTARGAFERLQGDFGGADELPKRTKFNLVLGDVHTEPEVFQHRDQGHECRWELGLHIANLEAAIRREPQHRLDPITVWCCGGRWIVLDGHYRLEAYTRYATEQGTPLNRFKVPCEAFKGSPYAAWDYSATANKKATRPLTTTERSNATWKRVCLSWKDGEWITSKAGLEELGLSCKNTISRMRRVLRGLMEKGLPEGDDPMDYTWMEAGRLLKGDHSSDYETDCTDEDPMVQVWAGRLTRTFGKEAWRAPLVFLQALERYSPKMTADLKDYLTDHDEEF